MESVGGGLGGDVCGLRRVGFGEEQVNRGHKLGGGVCPAYERCIKKLFS